MGIAIGDCVLNVATAADLGFLSARARAVGEFAKDSSLNRIFALEPEILTEFRRQIANLLDDNGPETERALANRQSLIVDQSTCALHLPVLVGDYTDFFAGIHHAATTGAILRPDSPLPPNYKWIPVAYHARSSSVVVSETPIHRPFGQVGSRGGQPPRYAASSRIDFELELGFYVGRGNQIGTTIDIADASKHIAGYCLLNDWSARDVQRWESVPLGPFLSKSFATTVSPWVVTSDALRPFRCPAMQRGSHDPIPLSYLFDEVDQENGGLDVELTVFLQTRQMRKSNMPGLMLTQSNARHLYWTPAQMVAHHASGGCNLRSGDLIGTGTISGPENPQRGSLLELTGGGKRAIELPNGEVRHFLEEGDEIVFRATCHRDGFASIGFGACVGRVSA